MTDSQVTQVAPLVSGSDTSDRRVSQVAPLIAGSDTSERRVSQVVVLVAGRTDVTAYSYWGIVIRP